MSQDGSRDQYDVWHDRVGAAAGVEDVFSAPWHVEASPFLDRHVPGKDVFEIGCGRGAMSEHLLTLGPRSLTAADFSPSAVRQTQDRLSGTLAHVAVEDIQDISHDNESFDTVVSFETVEHVPDPGKALHELARVLRPGGTLILTTPNYLGVYALYRGYKRVTGDPYTEVGQPINNFTSLPRTIRWVRRAGLVVDEWGSTGQYLLWPGRNPRRAPVLEKLGPVSRVTGLHSMVVATKPGPISAT